MDGAILVKMGKQRVPFICVTVRECSRNSEKYVNKGMLFSLAGPKYTGVGALNFGKKNRGGHKIFGYQNVGSYKMTTVGVFILFKKTNFSTIHSLVMG